MRFEIVAIGSVKAVFARPFEVLRTPIVVNAYGLVLVHNHPIGDCLPSGPDKAFTESIQDLCDKGGMIFHDHIIVGREDYFSFSDAGLF